MSEASRKYAALQELHSAVLDTMSEPFDTECQAVDNICDEMDGPWYAMSDEERKATVVPYVEKKRPIPPVATRGAVQDAHDRLLAMCLLDWRWATREHKEKVRRMRRNRKFVESVLWGHRHETT